MNEQITVYVVFTDMENDIPDAYVLHEDMAQELARAWCADYIEIVVDTVEWMALLTGGNR